MPGVLHSVQRFCLQQSIFETSKITTKTIIKCSLFSRRNFFSFFASSLFFLLFATIIIPTASGSSFICRRIPRLNAQQMRLCERYPELVPVIRSGVKLALSQCERFFAAHQTVHHAWSCNAFLANSTNRLFVEVNHPEITGTKELSLAHALVSAGVTYAISEACTRSDFPYCTCFDGHRLKESALLEENEESVDGSLEDANNVENFAVQTAADIRATYQWQGCLRNVDYGATMARRFLDSQERSHITPYSLVNLHNNLVGRKLIKDAQGWVRCQCHGISGSCTTKTCWRSYRGHGGGGEFAAIADDLFRRYLAAKEVSLGWLLDSSRSNLKKQFIQRTAKSSSPYGARHSHKKGYRKGKKATLWNKSEEYDAEVDDGSSSRSSEGWIQKFERVAQLDLNEPHHRRNANPKSGTVGRSDLVYVKQSVNFCLESAKRMKEKGGKSAVVPCVLPTAEQMEKRKEEGIGDYEEGVPFNSCHTVCCGRGYRAVVRNGSNNRNNGSLPMIIGGGRYVVPALEKPNVTEYECL